MTLAQEQGNQLAANHCPDCGNDESTPGYFCQNCAHLKHTAPNVKAATFGRRLGAVVLDIVLVPLTLFIGYLIWWLIVLANGQTPGKQLLGIRAVKVTGEPMGWGLTFVREFFIKGIVIGFLSGITGGILYAVNYLLPLFDTDNQTLHDKMISSVVIKDAR